ncbi:MAG: valine--tRNA ligase [Clostridia bacterium]|nr:valine--tRNA ligase [Clostridia bacterium]
MAKELSKIYDPKATEDRIYGEWLASGAFHADEKSDKEPFTIVIPPPNVTGKLHMGHALDETLQDILIRTKRMQGYEALWMPGTDHAGIATQIKVEAEIREKEGKTRYDYGREAFLEKVWDWKNLYGSNIVNQLKKLGSSCDWERERFTMDEGCSKAVREVFVSLYEKGLIYKGERIINWCPSCTTALSDAEVEYSEQEGAFWHIRYPFADDPTRFLTIATTRPETLLGDTAVAVNPEDERYTDIIGKKLILPLCDREIPVVADEYVDKEFGTGCVKVTPCHDPNDFEVAARHDLPHILIMDGKAKINQNGGKYCGMDRYEARKAIVKDLEEGGFLVKVEPHAHNVGTCYRCGTTVEPITSAQWFVKMEPLAKDALEVVRNGEIRFVPERFTKTYTNWMENVHDWCISRQLWWGHRIPAFTCEDCGEMTVAREDVTVCPKCGSTHITQDPDVLDTWFSSALWPFSTLGWPEKTTELEKFYPTSTLVTGYDIIFFWVARMIFSGMEHMKKKPFSTVFIHGLVRDSQGRKMSKSLGNGIDPLEIVENYGADALRFTLVSGISPGNDTRFYIERVEAMRNFANKLWNASRFVLMNLATEDCTLPEADKLTTEDKWILTGVNNLIREVTENIEKYELGVAAGKLYDFIWTQYCDWYIELTKMRQGTPESANASRVLVYVLTQILKLLHPFMPFITEEIYAALPHAEEGMLISAAWPTADAALDFPEAVAKCESLMAGIRAIRNRRAELNVPPSRKAHLIIVSGNTATFGDSAPYFERLASAASCELASAAPADAASMVSAVTADATFYMPMNDLVDKEKELARLEKELAKAESDIAFIRRKLDNPSFVAKAPAAVVEGEKAKLAKAEATRDGVLASIAALQ